MSAYGEAVQIVRSELAKSQSQLDQIGDRVSNLEAQLIAARAEFGFAASGRDGLVDALRLLGDPDAGVVHAEIVEETAPASHVDPCPSMVWHNGVPEDNGVPEECHLRMFHHGRHSSTNFRWSQGV